jgi:signal peptidase I
MDSLTDKIAAVTPQTIVVIVAVLTVLRVLLRLSRSTGAGRLLAEMSESVLIALVLVFLLLRPFVAQTFFIPSGSMRPTLREGDRILVNKWTYRTEPLQRGDVIVFRAPEAASFEQKDFIKRLVGLPGDQIEVRAGRVWVGGVPLPCEDVRTVLGGGRSVSDLDTISVPPLRLTRDAIWLGQRRVTRGEFARLAGRANAKIRIEPGKLLRDNRVVGEAYVAEDPEYNWGPQVVPPGHLLVLGDNRNESHDGHKWGMLPRERVIGRADWVFWPPRAMRRIRHEPQQ